MTSSRKSLIFTVLDMSYGENAPMIRAEIRRELETHENHQRTFFQASTIAAPRCSSFLQAQKIVTEWANV